mgnify:CR=1 FL=1
MAAPADESRLRDGQLTLADVGTPLDDVTFVVVDLETTGGAPADAGITEIGIVVGDFASAEELFAVKSLADALGSVDSVARDVIKAENVIDYTPHENIAERFAKKFGATMFDSFFRSAANSVSLR